MYKRIKEDNNNNIFTQKLYNFLNIKLFNKKEYCGKLVKKNNKYDIDEVLKGPDFYVDYKKYTTSNYETYVGDKIDENRGNCNMNIYKYVWHTHSYYHSPFISSSDIGFTCFNEKIQKHFVFTYVGYWEISRFSDLNLDKLYKICLDVYKKFDENEKQNIKNILDLPFYEINKYYHIRQYYKINNNDKNIYNYIKLFLNEIVNVVITHFNLNITIEFKKWDDFFINLLKKKEIRHQVT